MTPDQTTILLVDDDKLVLSTFCYALEQKGYRVLLAENGRHALTHLEQSTPHVMFLDIIMPEKEGLETLIEIKKRFPLVPVYVMSGGGGADFLYMARKFGATGTIQKPITPKALIKLIEEAPWRQSSADRDSA